MSTQNDIKVKSFNANGKSIATKTFTKTMIGQADTTSQSAFAKAYVALVDDDSHTAQHVQYKDIDIDE